MITKEFLSELFEYKDNQLYWKVDRIANRLKGKPAGCLDGRGYLQTKIKNVLYKNHRLIFMMQHGYVPGIIDHVDGNPLNNKIANLRPATISQNAMNAKVYCTNKSGVQNVSWHKKAKKWEVKLQIKGKRIHFGAFEDIELAVAVAKAIRNKHYKEFAGHQCTETLNC
jgi:hypothetical protein